MIVVLCILGVVIFLAGFYVTVYSGLKKNKTGSFIGGVLLTLALGILLYAMSIVGQREGAYRMLRHGYTIQYVTDENHCMVDSIIKEFE